MFKLKKYFIYIIFLFSLGKADTLTNGEFWIVYDNPGSTTLSVTMNSINHAWKRFSSNSNTIVLTNFSSSFYLNSGSIQKGFDSPNDDNGYGLIPWGLIKINVSIPNHGNSEYFIDLRDKHWSDAARIQYDGVDSYIHIDQNTGNIWIEAKRDSPLENKITNIFNGSTIRIWEAFEASGLPDQSAFDLNIYLANVLEIGGGEILGGGYLKVNSNQYSSNSTPSVSFANEYIIATNEERFSNYNGSGVTYKHHHWNSNNFDYSLSRSMGTEAFSLDQRAKFQSLSPATIQPYNIDGGTNLDIDFQDPWYKEQGGSQTGSWKTYTGSFSPTGAYGERDGGIFKLQTVASELYYSTRVQTQQTKNGITYYFTGWSTNGNATLLQVGSNPSGYDQKAVVFTGDSAVVTANYKAHLGSGSVNALTGNTQHKIVRDIIGVYHAVYESAGKIFYTTSSNGGSTWSNEIYLSGEIDAFGYSCRNPVIDLYYDASVLTWKPVVLWESRLPDNSGFEIAGRRIYGTQWAPAEYVTNGNPVTTSNNGNPSLGYPYVVFKGSDGLYIMRCTSTGSYGGNWDMMQTKVPGTTSVSQNPSALYDPWKGTNLLHIAWDDNASLFYRNMTYSGGYQWSTTETVASGVDEISNTSPSIGMDYAGYIWISWKYLNTEVVNSNRIKTRKRLGTNSYGVVSSFGSGSGNPVFHSPSLSGNRQKPGNNDISIAWFKSTNEVQKVSYVNGAWGSISTLSSSNQTPQLVFNETAVPFTSKIGFSRNTSGPVYVLTPISFNEGGGMQKSIAGGAAKQYTRGVITSIDTIAYHIQFGNIQLIQPGNEPIKIALTTLPDTIPVNTVEEITSFLKSEPFVAAEQSELSVELQEYFLTGATAALNGNDIGYLLEFVDNGTQRVLYTMHVSHLSERKKTIEVLPYQFGVTGNKEVYVRLSIIPMGETHPRFTMVNEYLDESAAGFAKKDTKGNLTVIDFIPKDFSLEQNFPNPFNPTTTISYDLPKNDFVTLKIFDALGREIKTLVDDFKRAGRHSVEFNASGLSSGMYIYKLTSIGTTLTKRMILLK